MNNTLVIKLPKSNLRKKLFFNKISKNSQLRCDEIYLAKENCHDGLSDIPVLNKNSLYAVVKGSSSAISVLESKYQSIDLAAINPFTYELDSEAYISGKARHTENVYIACNKFDKNLDAALSFSWMKESTEDAASKAVKETDGTDVKDWKLLDKETIHYAEASTSGLGKEKNFIEYNTSEIKVSDSLQAMRAAARQNRMMERKIHSRAMQSGDILE